jgi:hypothetical protein
MKILYRTLFLAILFSLILIIMPYSTIAQPRLNSMQRTQLINSTDSLIDLYNKYSTFVEDAGNFSKAYAAQFIKLFSDKSLLFNDIDPSLKMPVNVINPVPGLTPEEYVRFAESFYPRGIGISDFESQNTTEPISVNNGKEYEITTTGQKKIETFAEDESLFTREFSQYEIQITCKSDLTNFKITSITLSGLKLNSPSPAIKKDQSKVIVYGPNGKTLSGVIVRLEIDGKEIGKKVSKPDGTAWFKQLERGKSVTIYCEYPKDSTISGVFPMKYEDFIKSEIKLPLAPKETISMTFRIIDEKGFIPHASINCKSGSKDLKLKSDRTGYFTIYRLPPGEKIVLIINMDHYEQKTEVVIVSDLGTSPYMIKMMKIPNERNLGVRFIDGINIPSFQSGDNDVNISSTPGMGLGLSINYQYFRENLKKKYFELGYYGELSYLNRKSKGKSDEYIAHYNYTDIEDDICTLNVTGHNITESYSLSSMNLGFGVIFRKKLQEHLSLKVDLGPVISLNSKGKINIESGTVDYSGTYGEEYFGVTIDDIYRLGYSAGTSPELTDNSLIVKGINLGLKIGLSVDYTINERFGINGGLLYMSTLTNMASGGSEPYFSYLKNNEETGRPITDYKGLFNTVDQYKQSLLAGQVGFTFKIL